MQQSKLDFGVRRDSSSNATKAAPKASKTALTQPAAVAKTTAAAAPPAEQEVIDLLDSSDDSDSDTVEVVPRQPLRSHKGSNVRRSTPQVASVLRAVKPKPRAPAVRVPRPSLRTPVLRDTDDESSDEDMETSSLSENNAAAAAAAASENATAQTATNTKEIANPLETIAQNGTNAKESPNPLEMIAHTATDTKEIPNPLETMEQKSLDAFIDALPTTPSRTTATTRSERNVSPETLQIEREFEALLASTSSTNELTRVDPLNKTEATVKPPPTTKPQKRIRQACRNEQKTEPSVKRPCGTRGHAAPAEPCGANETARATLVRMASTGQKRVAPVALSQPTSAIRLPKSSPLAPKPTLVQLPPKPADNMPSRRLSTPKAAAVVATKPSTPTVLLPHFLPISPRPLPERATGAPKTAAVVATQPSTPTVRLPHVLPLAPRPLPEGATGAVAVDTPKTVSNNGKKKRTVKARESGNTSTTGRTAANPASKETTDTRDTPHGALHSTTATLNAKDGAIRLEVSPTTIVDQPREAVPTPLWLDEPEPVPPLPPMEEIATKCWRCFEILKPPSSATEPCLYATHLHVVLDVRVCFVCAEAVAAIEASDDTDQSNFCAGCAVEDDGQTAFFLCDANGCKHVFCRHCVAQSWGGGKVGWQTSRQLLQTDEPWQCPGCAPPSALVDLQNMVTIDLECQVHQQDRNADFLLNLLDQAERAKHQCEIDTEEASSDPDESPEYLKALQQHDDRLDDFITGLLDELDTKHNLSAAVCYMNLGMPVPRVTDDAEEDKDDESDGEKEPDWVRRANRQVDKDRKRDKTTVVRTFLPAEAYENDDYEDVEDLGPDDIVTGDFTVSMRPGFGQGIRPTEQAIRIANANEGNVPISAVVNDADDQSALRLENQWAIGGGARKEFKRRRLSWSGAPTPRATPRATPRLPSLAMTSGSTDQEPMDFSVGSDSATLTEAGAVDPTSEPIIPSCTKENDAHNVAECDESTCSGSSDLVRLANGTTKSTMTTPVKRSKKSGPELPLPKCVVPVASPPHLNQPNKPLQLCIKGEIVHPGGLPNIRTVAVDARLSKQLKPHQRDGVQFMWNNCFADFAWSRDGDDTQIGGCILAHNMGLGKSFTTIALLHTVMTSRAMATLSSDGPLIRRVLLIVPVNTVTNWDHEFYMWQKNLDDGADSLNVTNLHDVVADRREKIIRKWSDRAGGSFAILLATDGILRNFTNLESYLKPDVLVMDEVHTMIRNPRNSAFKMLKALAPRRIIGLTGSPFQNNLAELFHMVNFLRPNFLGFANEAGFNREYGKPIADGMASNARHVHVVASLQKSDDMNAKLEPYVHRLDSSVLKRDLPPISQVVLHVRQSRMQAKFYRAHKRSLDTDHCSDLKSNFLKHYNMLRPINSHPGSLLFPTDSKKQKGDEKDEIGDWWRETVEEEGTDKVKGVMHGYKIALLFHILVSAQQIGDKVVIFANSLATLNYIEHALTLDWIEQVPGLATSFPEMTSTSWEKSKDFFRIDGTLSAGDRGNIIKQFESSDAAKAMLLSRAGGIGINLTSANRIVIIDQHFNPTISSQAISRVFRYGQTKPVFCYTMLTQGTTEEKVYGRCVNKTGIALRIIDSKTIDRCFTNEELQDLSNNLTWVQCDECDKWRVLLGKVPDDKLPDQWTCSMNVTDRVNNHCGASEKDQAWYEAYERKQQQSLPASPVKSKPEAEAKPSESDSPIVCDDKILKHILCVTEEGKAKTLICDHHFQEALMETATVSDTLRFELARLDTADPTEESVERPNVLPTELGGPSDDGRSTVATTPATVSVPQTDIVGAIVEARTEQNAAGNPVDSRGEENTAATLRAPQDTSSNLVPTVVLKPCNAATDSVPSLEAPGAKSTRETTMEHVSTLTGLAFAPMTSAPKSGLTAPLERAFVASPSHIAKSGSRQAHNDDGRNVDQETPNNAPSVPAIKSEHPLVLKLGKKSNFSSVGTNSGANITEAIACFDSDEDEPTDV